MSSTTKIAQAIAEFLNELIQDAVAAAVEDTTEAVRTPSQKSVAAKKASRKKKSEKKSGDEPAKVTVDDVRGALMRVIDKHGNDGATEVLERFEVSKVSELDKLTYAEVVEACETYLDENDDD